MFPKDIFQKGFDFTRNNPQLMYTLFLVIVIPLAFIYTSEAFLSIARKQNDLVEQTKAGLLHDSFSTIFKYDFSPELIERSITEIGEKNKTLTGFYVIAEYVANATSTYDVVGSLDKNEIPLGAYTPDETTDILMRFAIANPESPLTQDYYKNAERTWKTVSLVKSNNPEIAKMFIVTDVSMSNTDASLGRDIKTSYFVLFAIILLIILMLARHAKIIDYATLYKKLEEVDKMKDDFVSIAAHELRTPLTVIRGKLEMLNDLEHLSDKGKGTIIDIDNSAKDLNALVSDILDVSRLQEGRMAFHFSPVDPTEVINDVYRTYDIVAKEKNLKLNFNPIILPPINVDKTRFKQIMVNLVGNAIKYTKEGSVSIIPKLIDENKTLEIRVSDTGFGISAEAQKLLFSKFYRVKSDDTKSIVGTGLGLWITAEMVKKMNGTISVESIEGKGSDFIIRFQTINK